MNIFVFIFLILHSNRAVIGCIGGFPYFPALRTELRLFRQFVFTLNAFHRHGLPYSNKESSISNIPHNNGYGLFSSSAFPCHVRAFINAMPVIKTNRLPRIIPVQASLFFCLFNDNMPRTIAAGPKTTGRIKIPMIPETNPRTPSNWLFDIAGVPCPNLPFDVCGNRVPQWGQNFCASDNS